MKAILSFFIVLGAAFVVLTPAAFALESISDPYSHSKASEYDTIFFNDTTVFFFDLADFEITETYPDEDTPLWRGYTLTAHPGESGWAYNLCTPVRVDCTEFGGFNGGFLEITNEDGEEVGFESSDPNFSFTGGSFVEIPNPLTDPTGFVAAVLHNTGLSIASWFVPSGPNLAAIQSEYEDLKEIAFSVVPFAYFALATEKIPGGEVGSEATTLSVTMPNPAGGTFEMTVFDNSQAEISTYLTWIRNILVAALWVMFVGFLYERITKNHV